MTDYARRVERYLRDEYDVRPRAVRHGRHPAFEFDYAGAARIVTINAPGHKGDNLLALKLQDIRRQLGPPPPKTEEKVKMKLSDMLPQETAATLEARTAPLQPQLSTTPQPLKAQEEKFEAFAANYNSGLRVMLPSKLVESEFGDGAVAFEEHGDGTWALRAAAEGSGFGSENSSVRAGFRYATFAVQASKLFGVSPCEVTRADGALLIWCDPAKRKVVGQARAVPPKSQPRVDVSLAASPKPRVDDDLLKNTSTQWTPPPPRDRMLALLRELRAVEALGTHRLARVGDGRWEFRPVGETVKLED